jgi:integrase
MTNPKTGVKLSGTYRAKYVGAVENFVTIVRAEFDATVPANAGYLRGERPDRDVPTPRFLEPRIIDTLRKEENLALISDPAHRLAIRIMIHAGLRAGHTCSLPFDCLLDMNRGGTNDKWALTFVDTKSNRNVTLPIAPEVANAIRQHQDALHSAGDSATMIPARLFPNPRAHKTGQLAPEMINVTIARWVAGLGLREADGKLVNVTPHRFRHTFATEMLERGVPIDVVKELLGHRSLVSTQVYATVTSQRLRSEWEKSRVVNIRGESVALPTGQAADAEWLLHRIGKAVQPLSNGYCGLPIQQTCPHANACLDCDHFMTSKDFLPILRQQHEEHARFVSKAEREGHLRIAEINQRPMRNLERIIAAVEEDDSCLPDKSE